MNCLVAVAAVVAAEIVNVDVVSEPTALAPVTTPVLVFKEAPAGKEPAETEYVIVSLSESVAPQFAE